MIINAQYVIKYMISSRVFLGICMSIALIVEGGQMSEYWPCPKCNKKTLSEKYRACTNCYHGVTTKILQNIKGGKYEMES